MSCDCLVIRLSNQLAFYTIIPRPTFDTAGPVTITLFTTINTIEERIQRILEEKRELFDTILSDTTPGKSFGLTRQEIFSLFNLRPTEDATENAA